MRFQQTQGKDFTEIRDKESGFDNYEKELMSLKEIIASMNTEIEELKHIITGLTGNNNISISCTCKCICTRACEQIINMKIEETLQNHHDNTNHQKYSKLSETIDLFCS